MRSTPTKETIVSQGLRKGDQPMIMHVYKGEKG